MQTRTCTECKETKPVSEFHRGKLRKDGLSTYCKSCKCEQNRRYRAANKEKIAEYKRRWYKENVKQEGRRYKKRLKEDNLRSLEFAHNKGKPWEDWEDEFVMADNGLTLYQKAVKLGRSFYALRQRKEKIRKKACNELTNDTVRV